jgi:anti-sigma factor RsiW
MTWTCEQTEARLSDYLDGLLDPTETRAFNLHVNACERCTLLVSGVAHALGGLHGIEPVEPPPRLVYNILDKTLGPRRTAQGWRAAFSWLGVLASRRFAYSTVSFAASLLILLVVLGFPLRKPKLADLSPVNIYRRADSQAHRVYARSTKFISDLRVVYEIQSRLAKENELPVTPEGTVPQAAPSKEPGRTDGTRPTSPRQQNRAFDIRRPMEVLANAVPMPALSGRLYGQWFGRRIP